MRFIVALSGASGAIYALRLLEKLAVQGHHIHLVASEPACVSFAAETDIKLNAHRLEAEKLVPGFAHVVTTHSPREIGASIASGSVAHDGMVVVPCSMGTLARVAHGFSDSLITRAADVTLKERRKLLLVTRELPLSLVHLKNMTAATEAGATIFHACPHFYHRPQTVEEVADTVVDRILDHLGVSVETKRWKRSEGELEMNATLRFSPFTTAKNYLELVKFSHTIFALPFALASMLVASGGWPPLRILVWILVAMVGARTAAMGFNRIVDRKIDAQNPRTKGRELPSGKVSLPGAIALVIVASLLFFFAAYQINFLALLLSPLTLAVLFFYSLCKRFTSLSHFVLGLCLGIAPVGAWVAVKGQIGIPSGALCAAVLFWVAGFDIIYATMDVDFDTKAGLHSMVRRLGVARALSFARWLHVAFAANLVLFGLLAHLGLFYFAAVAIIVGFLVYEHLLVRPDDLRRVNAAFFTMNGAISVFFLAAIALDVFF